MKSRSRIIAPSLFDSWWDMPSRKLFCRVLGQGAHPNCEIPGKHAENRDPSRSLLMRAAVQGPVGHLEVLRSAPRMIDQKPYPRLNPACGGAARHREGTGDEFTIERLKTCL